MVIDLTSRPDETADPAEVCGSATQAAVKLRRPPRWLVTVALLSSLLAVSIYLLVTFSPLADAAGGCGGG